MRSEELNAHSRSTTHVQFLTFNDSRSTFHVKTMARDIETIEMFAPSQTTSSGRIWRSAPYFVSESNFFLGTAAKLFVSAENNILEEFSHWFPMTLVGPTKTGKTTWVNGIFWSWAKNHPRQKSVIMSGGDFSRNYRNAILTRTIPEFQEQFERVKLLIITDVQQLLPNPDAQQELVHIIDALANLETPILLTVNEDEDANGWNAKLFCRMQSGLLIKTVPPDDALRRHYAVELLRTQAFPESEIAFIADWVMAKEHLSMQAVKGEVMRISLGRSQSQGLILEEGRSQITATILQNWSATGGSPSGPVQINDIAKLTVREFGLTLAQLRGPSRQKTYVLARGAVVYLGRKLGNFTLEQLAEFLGRRDHTTISHAARTFSLKLEEEPEIKKIVQRIERGLR